MRRLVNDTNPNPNLPLFGRDYAVELTAIQAADSTEAAQWSSLVEDFRGSLMTDDEYFELHEKHMDTCVRNMKAVAKLKREWAAGLSGQSFSFEIKDGKGYALTRFITQLDSDVSLTVVVSIGDLHPPTMYDEDGELIAP